MLDITINKDRLLNWFYKTFLNKYKIKPSGNCPVQAEGQLDDGNFYYFRSRGEGWSVRIGKDKESLFENPIFYYEEYEFDWPVAGWIEDYQAIKFFNKAMKIYKEQLTKEKKKV